MDMSDGIRSTGRAGTGDAAVTRRNTTELRETAVKAESSAASETGTAPAEASTQARLSDILQSYGFKATDKNITMLTLMLENAMPLTRENVMRMNQALKLTDSPEKALFLLLNNIRLTRGNAAQLDGLVDGSIRITGQINSLLSAIADLNDPSLRESLLRILSTVENADMSVGTLTQNKNTRTATAAPTEAPGMPSSAGASAPSATSVPVTTTPATATPTTAAPAVAAPLTAMPGPTGDGTVLPSPLQTENAEPPTETANASNTPASSDSEPTATRAGNKNGALLPPLPAEAAESELATGTTEKAIIAQRSAQTAESGSTDELFEKGSRWQTLLAHSDEEASALTQSGPGTRTHAAKPPEEAPLRLSFKLAESVPADIDRFFNTLREALRETRQTLTSDGRAETPGADRVLQEIRSLTEHLDFTSQIKNQLFFQLPLYHNGQETHTALHVYKDAKSDRSRGGQTHSALIALDTAQLGHFETYVQKQAQSVTCQFRLRDKTVEQLVRTHIHQLDALLRENKYSLDAFTFLPPGEAYTLLDTPDQLEGGTQENGMQASFTFDRRI